MGNHTFITKLSQLKVIELAISKIGFLQIVIKTVGLQFKAIWQIRHLRNKKGRSWKLNGCNIDFLRGTEYMKVSYHPVFNSAFSNIVGS